MKISTPMFFIAVSLCFAASRSQFRFRSQITGETVPGNINSVVIPKEVLSSIDSKGMNIRVVDDSGRQMSLAYGEAAEPHSKKLFFPFRVIEHKASKDNEDFVLDKAPGAGSFDFVLLDTHAKNFERQVEVSELQEDKSYKVIKEDVVFDFVDWNRLQIDLPDTEAHTLRLRLKIPESAPVIDGYDLSERGSYRGDFSGLRINGGIRAERVFANHENETNISVRPVTVTRGDDTWVSFDTMSLPVMQIKVNMKGAAFVRKAELWGGESDVLQKAKKINEMRFYRLPGMNEAETRFFVPSNMPSHLFVRIINHGLEPLVMENVNILWRPHRVYFIPDPGRRYALLWGSEGDMSIDALGMDWDSHATDNVPVLTLLPSEKNPEYGSDVKKPSASVVRGWTWGVFALIGAMIGVMIFISGREKKE